MKPPLVTISVRVTPRADRDSIVGRRTSDAVLLLRTTAPPVDGAANAACIEMIADLLGIRRSQITLIGGATARDKRFAIADAAVETINERLASVNATD